MAIAPTVVSGLEINSTRLFSFHREYQLVIAAIAVTTQARSITRLISVR